MKRYQVKRWDKRNTLKAKKYVTPFLFMMWMVVIGMVYSVVFV